MTSSSDSTAIDNYADTSTFVRLLATKGRVRILDVLLRRPASKLTASQISEAAGIDPGTFSRNKDVLIEFDIVKSDKVDGKTYYQIDLENPVVQILGEAHNELMRYAPEYVENTKVSRNDYIGRLMSVEHDSSKEIEIANGDATSPGKATSDWDPTSELMKNR